MVLEVGVVMGLHAMYEIFVRGTEISLDIILTYLPVSLLYIASMAMGYLGLRYIELSISSPICNSSGALVAVMTLFMVGFSEYSPLALGAVALVCIGAIGLGVVDVREDDELRLERQKASNYKYSKSFLALALPVAYCILDAVGTFADNRVLETLNEDSANVAYELTFLFVGFMWFLSRRTSLFLRWKRLSTSVLFVRQQDSLHIFMQLQIQSILLCLHRLFHLTVQHLYCGAVFS